mmetsp:Transcript_87631/g.253069  ORF Transcript_87631/g.253069 Transcript_87631/m.253069 type:complete len:206 (+) Transcript_87631:1004-1621(+)
MVGGEGGRAQRAGDHRARGQAFRGEGLRVGACPVPRVGGAGRRLQARALPAPRRPHRALAHEELPRHRVAGLGRARQAASSAWRRALDEKAQGRQAVGASPDASLEHRPRAGECQRLLLRPSVGRAACEFGRMSGERGRPCWRWLRPMPSGARAPFDICAGRGSVVIGVARAAERRCIDAALSPNPPLFRCVAKLAPASAATAGR